MTPNPDQCGQPGATLILAALAGGLLGVAALFGPLAVHAWRHLHG